MMKKLLLVFGLLFPSSAFAAQATGIHELGTLQIDGSSSNSVSIVVPSSPTTHTVTLPSTVCSSGQTWTDNASGVMSCATVGAKQTIGGSFVANQAANTTKFYAPSGVSTAQAGTTTNFSIASSAGTFKNIYFSSNVAPGVLLGYSITLYTGTAGGTLTATTLTCNTALTTDTTCNDTTHAPTVTAGQAFVIQITSLAATTTIGNANWGVEFDSN